MSKKLHMIVINTIDQNLENRKVKKHKFVAIQLKTVIQLIRIKLKLYIKEAISGGSDV